MLRIFILNNFLLIWLGGWWYSDSECCGGYLDASVCPHLPGASTCGEELHGTRTVWCRPSWRRSPAVRTRA